MVDVCNAPPPPAEADFRVFFPAAARGRYFRGTTMLDELAFSYYYHYTTFNQTTHQVSLLVQSLALMALLSQLFGLWFAGVIAVAYSLRLATYDVVVGLTWAALFASNLVVVGAGLVDAVVSASGVGSVSVASALTFGAGLLLQLLGHVEGDGRFPAFRLYEAAVITPFLMSLAAISWFTGYRRADMDAIRKRAPMWQGTARVELRNAVPIR